MADQHKVCVFVDARMAQKTGIGRCIAGHLGGLCERQFDIIAGVGSTADADIVTRACKSAEISPYDAPLYGVRERLVGLGGPADLRDRVHVYWYPQYNVPLYLPRASVITIHDLIQFRSTSRRQSAVSATSAYLRSLMGQRVLKRAVRQAARIVCVSKTTQEDLENFIPGITRKTVVIRNGVSDEWASYSQKAAETVRLMTASSPYFLAVGMKKDHKNHSLLLKVIDGISRIGLPHKLVIIGKTEMTWTSDVQQWALGGGCVDRLVDIANVSDAQLAAYYGCASALLMPSFYEGFGLPPLEAMVAGTPVVCSNRGALPETVGQAAVLLDPADASAWIATLTKLQSIPEMRDRLVSAGRAHVRDLTWTSASADLSAVLHEVATEHGRKVQQHLNFM